MSEQNVSRPGSETAGGQDMMSELFARLILQQTNMAMMLLGKVAHPETGQVYKDLEAARLFIDELEMLEAKTKGNLTKEESGLLKQSLMNLRLAFVEAVESPEPQHEPAARESNPSTVQPAPKAAESSGGESSAATDDEHRKKFSKKY